MLTKMLKRFCNINPDPKSSPAPIYMNYRDIYNRVCASTILRGGTYLEANQQAADAVQEIIDMEERLEAKKGK